jgi:hypothetical protein
VTGSGLFILIGRTRPATGLEDEYNDCYSESHLAQVGYKHDFLVLIATSREGFAASPAWKRSAR